MIELLNIFFSSRFVCVSKTDNVKKIKMLPKQINELISNYICYSCFRQGYDDESDVMAFLLASQRFSSECLVQGMVIWEGKACQTDSVGGVFVQTGCTIS